MLSFFSIFGIQNNMYYPHIYLLYVVNCFHFSVSLGYKTTLNVTRTWTTKLWIAFIFQYLWDTKQQQASRTASGVGCELLSFFSIFGIQNNLKSASASTASVVNCFHFSVSLGYKTTIIDNLFHRRPLWIAFIFQYLWDTKQPFGRFFRLLVCCELLSFFSIFGIQNNLIR